MKVNVVEAREIQAEREARRLLGDSGFTSVEQGGEYELVIDSIQRKLSSGGNVYDEATFQTVDGTKNVKHRFFYTPKSLPIIIEFYEMNGVTVTADKDGNADLELMDDFDGVIVKADVVVTELIKKDSIRITPNVKKFIVDEEVQKLREKALKEEAKK